MNNNIKETTSLVFVKGKNLFNKNKVIKGYELIFGELSTNSDWWVSDYILVNENTTYYKSGNITAGTAVAFYDENKNYISQVNVLKGSFIADTGLKYIRINGKISEIDNNIMIEQGTSETTYKPYIEKEILVKNDNGVFEKFYDESDITVEETSYQVVWNNEPYTFNFKKYGKIVTLQVLASNSADLNGIPITTIPERFRPAFELSFAVLGYGVLIGTAWLTTEGKLYVKTSAGNMVRIMITYVTK